MHHIEVKCYSGYTYPEEPRAFGWGGVNYEVEEVETAWQEPGAKLFRVRTRDNKLFNLCYNELEKNWTLRESRGGE